MLSTDNPTKAHANAYKQLATLQTKLDEDDYILSILQSHACDDDNHSTRCDGYDLAIEIIAARHKELDRELRKVKKYIVEIEEKWGMWRA